MRIAITGSTGLIGGRIAARFSAEHELVRLGRRPGCDVTVDLARPESVAAINLSGAEALIHCAGIVDEDFRKNPSATFLQSTLGTKLLIERALAAGVRTAVYFSTSHVYGPPRGVQDETTPPCPQSDYAIAHYASERFFERAADRLRVLVLRPNAVFGVPVSLETFDRWSLIPFSFPLEAITKGEIVLKSSGEQYRNFVSTDDLADDVASWLTAGSEPSYLVRNPLGSDSLTVYEFAKWCASACERLTGKPCYVRRPESAGHESGKDFSYRSLTPTTSPRRDVKEYLQVFMKRLLEESKDGRQYGS